MQTKQKIAIKGVHEILRAFMFSNLKNSRTNLQECDSTMRENRIVNKKISFIVNN